MSSTEYQDTINTLRCEIAYLNGKIEAYEKILKARDFIKEEDERNN